jgi:hypothetical protein
MTGFDEFPILTLRPPGDGPHAPADPPPPTDTSDWRWQPVQVTYGPNGEVEELGRPFPPGEEPVVEIRWA